MSLFEYSLMRGLQKKAIEEELKGNPSVEIEVVNMEIFSKRLENEAASEKKPKE